MARSGNDTPSSNQAKTKMAKSVWSTPRVIASEIEDVTEREDGLLHRALHWFGASAFS